MRQDYVTASEIIRNWKVKHHVVGIAIQEAFVDFFQIGDKSFDVDKFRDLCIHPENEAALKRHGWHP